jgi:hypothetical protein
VTYVTTGANVDFLTTVSFAQQYQPGQLHRIFDIYFRALQKHLDELPGLVRAKPVESGNQAPFRPRRPVYFEVTKLRLNKGIGRTNSGGSASCGD